MFSIVNWFYQICVLLTERERYEITGNLEILDFPRVFCRIDPPLANVFSFYLIHSYNIMWIIIVTDPFVLASLLHIPFSQFRFFSTLTRKVINTSVVWFQTSLRSSTSSGLRLARKDFILWWIVMLSFILWNFEYGFILSITTRTCPNTLKMPWRYYFLMIKLHLAVIKNH